MRRQENRWKWPLCTATAVALVLTAVWLTPRGWIEALFLPRLPVAPPTAGIPPPPWLELLPPEVLLSKPDIEPDQRPRPRPAVRSLPDDAEWWQRAWQLHIDRHGVVQRRQTEPDSGRARPFTPLSGDLHRVARQQPDSTLISRLALLRLTDSMDLRALRPRLDGMILGRMFTDLQSREADMFDEHLNKRIMTTDGPDEKEMDARARPSR